MVARTTRVKQDDQGHAVTVRTRAVEGLGLRSDRVLLSVDGDDDITFRRVSDLGWSSVYDSPVGGSETQDHATSESMRCDVDDFAVEFGEHVDSIADREVPPASESLRVVGVIGCGWYRSA
jgi:hypothetical protein